MSLTILHTESSRGWGGQEIRILVESEGLIARGHQVTLAAAPDAEILPAARERGITVHELPIAKRSLTGLRTLRRLIGSLRPDVIVSHSSNDSWLVALATRFDRHRPAIVRLRHLSLTVATGPANRWLYGTVPDKVVTTGEAIRAMLIERLRLDPDRIVSIPTGIDLDRFRPGDRIAARTVLGLPLDRTVIGIVATLRSWKGHRYLIEALKDPRLAEAVLVIVGDGPQQPALPELAEAAGVADRVVMAGRRADVVPWLQAFDIFALPSTGNEGVPQAVLQAMAAGLPVVATPVGAIGEVVTDGVTGLLVPPHDATALADGLARLVADPVTVQRLGDEGLHRARARHGIGIMLDQMEAVLQEAGDRHA